MRHVLLRAVSSSYTTEEPSSAENYLSRGFKLVQDTLAMCLTPAATANEEGSIDFGDGG